MITNLQLNEVQKEIRSSPFFEETYIDFRAKFLNDFLKHHFFAYIMSEETRYYIILEFLRLYYGSTIGVPQSGATIGRLKDFAAKHGLASPSRVWAMVSVMKYGGVLKQKQISSDKRTRFLEPTDFGREIITNELNTHFGALAMLKQEPYRPEEFAGEGVRYLHFQNMIDLLFRVGTVASHVPLMKLFFDKHCGYEMLLKLLMCEAASVSDSGRIVETSFAELADYLKVARAHVRGILVSAQDAGLLRILTRGGTLIEVTPELENLSRDCVAFVLAYCKIGTGAASRGERLFADD